MSRPGRAVVALSLEGGQITETWPDVLNLEATRELARTLGDAFSVDDLDREVESAEQIAVLVRPGLALEEAKAYLSSVGWEPINEGEELPDGAGWSVLTDNTRRVAR